MKAQKVKRYDAPHQFEPLLPAERMMEPLRERASDLTRAATLLGASAAAPTQRELRALLRSMNSYYTNRIEGEHTRPSDIDRALQNDFSSNAELARKQRLAVAHIRTEERCERALDEIVPADDVAGPSASLKSLYGADALVWLHEELFTGLPEQDLRLSDGSVMVPGLIRETQVAVGRHESPVPESLAPFIERWAAVYGGARRGEASVVSAAASHHRLAWIHPFPDGNGRVARLHTHLALHAMGLTHGLWSPLRGFARSEERYKALLQAADEHRRGDLDGRGNLSEAALIEWIHYTLDVCIDQVQFMSRQIDVTGMKERLEAALAFEEAKRSGVRREALIPLHYLFVTQAELGRAEFKTMSGMGDRSATGLVSSLLRTGYLASDSAYGKVRFAIPRHALRFLFPALWPEAEQDQALLSTEMGRVGVESRRPQRLR
ncbi:Fic family protein [Piscinibacter sp.]|uniref:Fic family protein n=1 Tax=Piscinibacter sp. TaxID=1903157 RepID=UPI002BADB704|nr:Fic family protein [Albitalea sp.]HUG26360.1 Fic family protein [Albitalea sp.]